ncbi:MAG: sulfotransferase [Neomegalonema sp.]|nr:sulfotransferase [Neomegalonema sp.]
MARKSPRKPTAPNRRAASGTVKPSTPSFAAPTILTPGAKSARDLEIDAALKAAISIYGKQDFAKAEKLLNRILEVAPEHVGALRERGFVRSRGLQDLAGADKDFEAALKIKRNAELLSATAEHNYYAGRMDDAIAYAREAIELEPSRAEPYTIIARIQGARIDDETLEQLKAAIDHDNASQYDRYFGLNALGRIYEKRQDYDLAFEHFDRANQFAGGEYSAEQRSREIEDYRQNLDASFFERRRGYGVKDQRPVFVVGAPRSGSTLLEQVLTAHPKIDSVAEYNGLTRAERLILEKRSGDRPHYLSMQFIDSISKSEAQAGANYYLKEALSICSNRNALRILDKALINFLRIPLILTLFPRASIVHTFRHPMDTCISCFKQDFRAAFYASRQDLLSHFFRTYYDFMEHMSKIFPDRLIHVCHEDFVTAFQAKAPAAVEAIGAPWDDACLHPEKNQRLVHTHSANSVRSPVNTSSFGAWKNYERHLQPMIEGLGGLAAIEARYEAFRARSI